MTNDSKIRDDKVQYVITEIQSKYKPSHQPKLKNMNILLMKKYYLRFKVEWSKKLNLHIPRWENHLKNQEKRFFNKYKKTSNILFLKIKQL